jgi:hypothetical protein
LGRKFLILYTSCPSHQEGRDAVHLHNKVIAVIDVVVVAFGVGFVSGFVRRRTSRTAVLRRHAPAIEKPLIGGFSRFYLVAGARSFEIDDLGSIAIYMHGSEL